MIVDALRIVTERKKKDKEFPSFLAATNSEKSIAHSLRSV